MARRRMLGDDVWARLIGPPADEREVARLYTPNSEDMALIGERRTDATRLGYALVLLYLRHPGRVLEAGEAPPAPGLRRPPARRKPVDAWRLRGARRHPPRAARRTDGGGRLRRLPARPRP